MNTRKPTKNYPPTILRTYHERGRVFSKGLVYRIYTDCEVFLMHAATSGLIRFADGRQFAAILADPPGQFTNKTGKVAPEHKRLSRYGTMKLDEIMALPVAELAT